MRLVSRNAFRPRPKVESAIIKITPHKDLKSAEESETYYTFIKALFAHPRKTVTNNISDGLGPPKEKVISILKTRGVEPNLRSQNLDIDTINNLAHDFISKTL